MSTTLTKLTLKNFKSFKKAEIPISKGFTAIVGSNGSGKSNVLDALLFVLGITSLKTLRASKLTDLVNNTAKENYAKVDLKLKGNDKEFEISRMIDKQGKSVYRLDGKRTTLNEVNSLLVELGIDITGHNIVTQGDITKVVNMSSIERREIIDSIAGLSEFDQKKEEAIKELDKVDLRIKEATIILNERNNFLEEMENEMNSAKEFEALEKEKKQIKATILSKELYIIEKRLNEIDFENKEIDKIKTDLEESISRTKQEIDEGKTKLKEVNNKAMQGSEEIYNKIGKGFEEKKALLSLEKERIFSLKEKLNASKNKIKTNNKLQEDLEQKKIIFTKKISELNLKQQNNQNEINHLKIKKDNLEKIVIEKNDEIKKIESEFDENNKEIEVIRKDLFDLEVFEKQWEKQKSFNQTKLNEIQKENNELIEKINLLNELKKKIELKSKNKFEEEINNEELKLEEALTNRSQLRVEIKNDEKAIIELKKEISKCPVCESDLKTEKKEDLLQKKELLINENKNKLLEAQQKIDEIHNIILKLKEELNEFENINSKVSEITNFKIKKEELEKKEKELLIELDEKKFEIQLNKKKIIDENLRKFLLKRDEIKEILKTKRSMNIFDDYSIINNNYNSLLHNISLIKSNISEINSELKSIDTKENELTQENKQLTQEIDLTMSKINEKEPLLKEIETDILNKEKSLASAKKEHEQTIIERDKLELKIEKLEKELIIESTKIKKFDQKQNEFNIEKSKLEVKQNDLNEESKEFIDTILISEKSIEELKNRVNVIIKRIEEIGAVNMKAVENFSELKKEVEEIQEKTKKLEEERFAVLDMIDKIDVKRTSVFMDCFNEVNKNFMDMFSKFFNGEGLLDLTNPSAPLESGLIIDAKPKGGKLQNIDSMSGGEKTLTALAFMFAIQLYSPAPFYAFDEADAALDKENSLKMGNLIEMISKKSQFIAITHNDTITKKSDQIVGVALNKDQSSAIGLKLKNRLAS